MYIDNNIRWLRTTEEIFPHRPLAMTLAFQTEQYNYKMHEHDFFEINIILEGSGYHYIEKRRLKVIPGDMFVIPPGVLHGYENIDPIFNVFHLVANQAFFDKYSDMLSNLRQFKLLFEIEPQLRANEQNFYMNLEYDYLLKLKNDITILDEIEFEESDEADTIRNIMTLKIITSLCLYASRDLDQKSKSDQKNCFDILMALEYIHNNYSEKITVKGLSELCNVSKSTFLRKFKTMTNSTPNRYILDYRAKKAESLLSMGISRTEAAQLCGFFDISHMDRVLLKYEKKS